MLASKFGDGVIFIKNSQQKLMVPIFLTKTVRITGPFIYYVNSGLGKFLRILGIPHRIIYSVVKLWRCKGLCFTPARG